MSSRATLPRATRGSQTTSMTTKWQGQVLPQDSQGPVIGHRVTIRIDDPPRARPSQRPVAEQAIQLTQHHIKGNLMHTSVELARRKVATIVARPAGKALATPYTHNKGPPRNASCGIGRSKDSYQTRFAQTRQMQRAGVMRNHCIARVEGTNHLRQ